MAFTFNAFGSSSRRRASGSGEPRRGRGGRGGRRFQFGFDTLEARRVMAADLPFDGVGLDGLASDDAVFQTRVASPEPAAIGSVEAGESRVRLTWSHATSPTAGRSGYEAQVSVAGGEWTPVARVVPLGPDTTAATVNHLVNGVSHAFRIVASFDDGSTVASSPSPAVVPQAPTPGAARFAAPANVSASAASGAASVRWSAVAGAIDGYVIEYSVDGGWSWVAGGQAAKSATSLLVGGLTDGVPCQFRVAARDAVGRGAFSKPTPAASIVPGTDANETYADSGNSSYQFTADGRLAQLVRDSVTVGEGTVERLVFRMAGAMQDMVEDVLVEGALWPISSLVFTPDGKANVLVVTGSLRHFRLEAGGWQLVTEVPLDLPLSPTLLVARAAGDGTLHFVVGTLGGFDFGFPGSLLYGTNAGGDWNLEQITDVAETMGFSYAGSGRHVGLAIGGDGKAHVVYTPQIEIKQRPDRFTPIYSELAYATNRSGTWTTEIVHRPPDGTGESGGGASIAMSPSGEPLIAHFSLDSVATGSAASARLLVQQRKAGGGWTAETVVSTPDGYALGDGAKFTGFAPLVAFDRTGVPHIAFSDMAARHNPSQQHFVGQIRHAWKSGGRWQVETVYRQSNPLDRTMALPSLAIGPDSIVYTGLELTRTGASFVKIVRPLAAGGGSGGGGRPGDTTPPAVTSIKPPAARTYAAGSQLTFTVTFNEKVNVTGVPGLPVQVGESQRLATYVKGSGTKSLAFALPVQAGDVDSDGVTMGSTIVQDAGSIRDAAGNTASGAIPAVNTGRVRVDAVGPLILAVGQIPSGPFKVGQKVTLTVTFSEPVVVKGKPTATLTIGGVPRTLTYSRGTNTSTLTFTLAVKKGDPLEGVVALAGPLGLPARSSIQDVAGNPLVSTALPVTPA